jgi:hypothetical protein
MSAVEYKASGFTNGSLETLKWIALVAMTIDHVNSVLLGREYGWMFAVGRLAYPLFAFVVAVNLARPYGDKLRSVKRLLLWGCVAQIPHMLAFQAWLPLNVLFTFGLAGLVLVLWERRQEALAVVVFLGLSLFVDYQWSGVALVLAVYHGAKNQWREGVFACLVALWSLTLVNGSWWQWVALLPVLLVYAAQLETPRLRWAFYGYYVGHFVVLAAVASVNLEALRS